MPTKTIFKSKMALAGAISAVAGAVGTFVPDAAPLVAQYASAILLVSGLVQIALRLVTSGRVTLYGE